MGYSALDQSLVGVKGIGIQKARQFEEMGIHTVRDLLFYFPYRYVDYQVKDLATTNHGEKITVEGTIYGQPVSKRLPKKRSLVSVKVVVDHFMVTAIWFNRAYLKNQLQSGRPILLTGKWDKYRLQITVSEHEFLDTSKTTKKGHLVPVYSLPSDLGLTQSGFRKIIDQAIRQYYYALEDYLPQEVIDKYKLYTLKESIRAIHFPNDRLDGKMARRRLVYDELLLYQMRIQLLKKLNRQNWPGIKRKIEFDKVKAFIRSLPFSLTDAQLRVIGEILGDMEQSYAMNRLLQGDVGSGKTVVAAVALYANFLSGYQGALMVPTEILAEQHAASLKNLFANTTIQVELLTGSLTEKNREAVIGRLQMGLTDVVVGTHALIQEDVYFKQLGLVITDEQHRFGVEQRAILRRKSDHLSPDVLYMTATPIPRTLAITAYGDMDVSIIDQYPAGRKKVETHWVRPKQFEKVLAFIDKHVRKGRQAYVIAPLIEESDKLDVQNAIDIYQQLGDFFPNFKIGLMHGRLKPKEKDEVMSQFIKNEVQILVSTTVVEVGVNVPNATIMVIYDADRFGLAQLHQLRGRVGRGEHQSYCILVADPKSETGKERMRIMEQTNNGFEISRRDLELRGPGDFFGVKQSGLPEFKLADLMQDYRTLEVAKKDAEFLIHGEVFWHDLKWEKLRIELERVGGLFEQVLEG
ncbi:ATP-dependent DNA helicase RecG [Tepidibacillus fermentans]|uniref:ATP-dependent DNA helicase RecG n=1 Tax=Tepidibacillus fermentans TaxID=1281767 RepID=A0A4R3KKD5_9BACI|nr:ATP-dependent DNA helicase RecG [Tepidibacillus fermentans]TCS84341.1 ATP-dependent DNA helicase RecG [Tepidibacillus fermentans]